jgi:AGCS family alanine or glycine:cation symporter
VIIGGIRRIGEVTSRIVPAMCVFYVSVCLFIILRNFGAAGAMFTSIFTEAFSGAALGGGAAGGLIRVFAIGAQRAVFSNEAGVGSAAIAHSAAKTDEPIREGVVAMIGPFIDTIVICTMTALTLLITDVFDGVYGQSIGFGDGAIKTIEAFGTVHKSLEYALCGAIFVLELLRRSSGRVSGRPSRSLAVPRFLRHTRGTWTVFQLGKRTRFLGHLAA